MGGHDADDIAQEAVLRAWRHRGSCRTPQQPWSWLRTIVHREVARARSAPASGDDPVVERGSADPRLERVIEREALRPALDRLDARGRALIVLHYDLDLSLADIARVLDMPLGSVKVTLARTRVKLRDTLT